ncbi:MAG: tetratricopeptide repeat protein, partial [bacterium]|nr:tetratricopeptide repeat protein [bacterium]
MKKKLILPFAVLVLMVFIFYFIEAESHTKSKLDAEGVALHNRGVALMGQFEYQGALTIFEKLARQYPDNLDIQVNQAIATLNRQLEGDEKISAAILEKVLQKSSDNLRGRYCSGLLELHMGRPGKALEFFNSVLESDPEDAEVLYF